MQSIFPRQFLFHRNIFLKNQMIAIASISQIIFIMDKKMIFHNAIKTILVTKLTAFRWKTVKTVKYQVFGSH